ncbi:Ketoreductase azaE [Erysiphe neolycopersici]|uniref:Ketoreductase azaE n=1 Tax=Erysiphe neolycopersici TaxID=212602 RepID=A0A420HE46_9PEZI|nr:Ketoreductase azaE [Erysiphe neolycopersici]
MTKVLLTGGSGFIAAHVLDLLLKRGHNVITTVRSEEKASKIRDAFRSSVSSGLLDFRIVEDIAQPGAFDEALKIEGLEVVIHTASPFQLNVKDVKKDLLDPAINGTKGILEAIKNGAPSVRKVIITSSFAAIIDINKAKDDPSIIYTEKSWNPITEAQALESSFFGYRASKTFAERAAWEFVEKEKPNFTISTINPPIVYGPIVHYLNSLDKLNTSNTFIYEIMSGKRKEDTLDSRPTLWVDVRDVALAHIKAFELEEAAGQRLFVTAGLKSMRDIADVIRKDFPELTAKLPNLNTTQPPANGYKYDNSLTTKIVGPTQYSFEQSIDDTVKSLQSLGA